MQHGGRRYSPYAFTEQGVAIIIGILKAVRELMNPPEPKRRGIRFTADLSEE